MIAAILLSGCESEINNTDQPNSVRREVNAVGNDSNSDVEGAYSESSIVDEEFSYIDRNGERKSIFTYSASKIWESEFNSYLDGDEYDSNIVDDYGVKYASFLEGTQMELTIDETKKFVSDAQNQYDNMVIFADKSKTYEFDDEYLSLWNAVGDDGTIENVIKKLGKYYSINEILGKVDNNDYSYKSDGVYYKIYFNKLYIHAVWGDGWNPWTEEYDDPSYEHHFVFKDDGEALFVNVENYYDKDLGLVRCHNTYKLSKQENGNWTIDKTSVFLNELDLYKSQSVIASSEHKDYKASNVDDRDYSTAWVEDKPDSGIGESVIVNFDGEVEISGLEILNGYGKSKELYYANNRVKKIRIELSDGTAYERNLLDGNYEGPTSVLLPEKVNTEYIKVTILDVYRGSEYDDTCISEIFPILSDYHPNYIVSNELTEVEIENTEDAASNESQNSADVITEEKASELVGKYIDENPVVFPSPCVGFGYFDTRTKGDDRYIVIRGWYTNPTGDYSTTIFRYWVNTASGEILREDLYTNELFKEVFNLYINGELNYEEVYQCIGMSKVEIEKNLGEDYVTSYNGPEGTFETYLYEDLGLEFAFDYPCDEVCMIYCDETACFKGVRAGMSFDEIMDKLGKREISELGYGYPVSTIYCIDYEFENYRLTFVSYDKEGNDTKLWFSGR